MLKVKVKIKGHVIGALSWILGMSYSVIDGLVILSNMFPLHLSFFVDFVDEVPRNKKIHEFSCMQHHVLRTKKS